MQNLLENIADNSACEQDAQVATGVAGLRLIRALQVVADENDIRRERAVEVLKQNLEDAREVVEITSAITNYLDANDKRFNDAVDAYVEAIHARAKLIELRKEFGHLFATNDGGDLNDGD